MLLILNVPLVGLFINLLRAPQHYLFPGILLVCFVGVYSVNLSGIDLWIMADGRVSKGELQTRGVENLFDSPRVSLTLRDGRCAASSG